MATSATPLLQPAASLRRYVGEYGAHAHDHAQVLVGLAGSLEMELAGHSAFIDASSALIVPADVSHAYLAKDPAQLRRSTLPLPNVVE